MNTLNTTNNYQAMNIYQRPLSQGGSVTSDGPSILPIDPKPPKIQYTPENIYKASNGNLIADREGNLAITPQGELNLENTKQATKDEKTAEIQAKKDELRDTAVDYVGYQSKKSQVEIYLSVATDNNIDLGNDLADTIENLREVQKQNNAVEAYAQYQENQQGGEALLF